MVKESSKRVSLQPASLLKQELSYNIPGDCKIWQDLLIDLCSIVTQSQ